MALSLEVFAADPKASPDQFILDQIAFKREQTSSYETGYRAGWEEASATATALAARNKATSPTTRRRPMFFALFSRF